MVGDFTGISGHSRVCVCVCVLKLSHSSFSRAIAMAMDPTQHMLNIDKSEFDTLATLLARGHISGDTAILEKHVEKAYQELIAGEHLEKLVEYSGGMSEAAKRSFLMNWTPLRLLWKRGICKTW